MVRPGRRQALVQMAVLAAVAIVAAVSFARLTSCAASTASVPSTAPPTAAWLDDLPSSVVDGSDVYLRLTSDGEERGEWYAFVDPFGRLQLHADPRHAAPFTLRRVSARHFLLQTPADAARHARQCVPLRARAAAHLPG